MFSCFLFFSCNKNSQIFTVLSPSNQIKINIFDDANHINYQVFLQDSNIIDKSRLGLKFKNGDYFPKVEHLKSIENKTHKYFWELPWGETRKPIPPARNQRHAARKAAKSAGRNDLPALESGRYYAQVPHKFRTSSA